MAEVGRWKPYTQRQGQLLSALEDALDPGDPVFVINDAVDSLALTPLEQRYAMLGARGSGQRSGRSDRRRNGYIGSCGCRGRGPGTRGARRRRSPRTPRSRARFSTCGGRAHSQSRAADARRRSRAAGARGGI